MSAICCISGASSSIAPSLRVTLKKFAMSRLNDVVSLRLVVSFSALSNNAVIFGIIFLINASLACPP
jgi:hypothetical protein